MNYIKHIANDLTTILLSKQPTWTELVEEYDDNQIHNCVESAFLTYIPSDTFFDLALKQYKPKNMQEITALFTNFDINKLKECIKIFDVKIVNEFCSFFHINVDDNVKQEFFKYADSDPQIYSTIQQAIKRQFDRYIYNRFRNDVKDDFFTQAYDLDKINDAKGQETIILRTDYNNRDFAFVDVNGEILISDHGESHAQLINKFLAKKEKRLSNNWKRPKKDEIVRKLQVDKYAFGHKCGNSIIIDSMMNLTIDDIVADLKANNIKGKVYSFKFADGSKYYGTAKREAKRMSTFLRLAKVDVENEMKHNPKTKEFMTFLFNRLVDDDFFNNLLVNRRFNSIDDVKKILNHCTWQNMYEAIINLDLYRTRGYRSMFIQMTNIDLSHTDVTNFRKILNFVLSSSNEYKELAKTIIHSKIPNFISKNIQKLFNNIKVNFTNRKLPDTVESAYDLEQLNDSKDWKTNINILPDVTRRDCPFVDFDGKIIVGNNGETHAQLINNYIEEQNQKRSTGNAIRSLSDSRNRPNPELIMKMFNLGKITFGHICGKVWIVEASKYNNVQQVKNDLLISGLTNDDKIYFLFNKCCTRLARKI